MGGMGIPTFHTNIGTIPITSAIGQIKSQPTKTHGAWIGHIITDVMLLPSVCVSPLAAKTVHTWGVMLSTSVLTFRDQTACCTWQTAWCSSARSEGGRSMSRQIQLDTWSQIYSIGFMSGLIVASPRPQRHVGPEMRPYHALDVAGNCLAQAKNSDRRPPTPHPHPHPHPPPPHPPTPLNHGSMWYPRIYMYSDAYSSSHPVWPGWSSRYDGLRPWPWLLGCDFQELDECMHQSSMSYMH